MDLSQAALEFLREYADERRDRLLMDLQRAASDAASRDGAPVASVVHAAQAITDAEESDLLHLARHETPANDSDLLYPSRSIFRRSFVNRLLSLYVIFGLLGVIIVALLSFSTPQGSEPWMRAILVSFSIVSLFAFSWKTFLQDYRPSSSLAAAEQDRRRLRLEFLESWNQFESALRARIDSPNSTLIADLSSALSRGLLSTTDFEELQRLLRLRNGLVHSDNDTAQDSQQIATATRELEQLASRVSSAKVAASTTETRREPHVR